MRIQSKVFTPVFIAPAVAAVAIALAPLAAAETNAPACINTGSSTQCDTSGNAQIDVAPPIEATAPGAPYFASTYGPFFGYDRGRG
jgi:hypothetical protein